MREFDTIQDDIFMFSKADEQPALICPVSENLTDIQLNLAKTDQNLENAVGDGRPCR